MTKAMVSIRGMGQLAWTELKLFFREPIALFFNLVLPLMVLYIFGSSFGANDPGSGGYGAVDYMMPGYGALFIANVGLMSIPVNISTYRERKILRRLMAVPIRPLAVIFAFGLVSLGTTALCYTTTMVVAKLAYNLRFFGDILTFVFAFLMCSLSFFALGFLVAGISSTSRIAQAIGSAIFFLALFLSDAVIPVNMLSPTLQQVSEYIPLTHAVKLFRGIWLGKPWADYWAQIIVLLALLVVSVAVSLRVYKWRP
jgi:ABC-2 type transport system permease protein